MNTQTYQIYKKEIGTESYQPLSNLLAKLNRCLQKYTETEKKEDISVIQPQIHEKTI